MFYFCHIPKTSGSSIEAAIVDEYFDTVKIAQSNKIPKLDNEIGIKNFLSNCSHYGFVKGHFGTLPYSFVKDIKGYSIIREPIDRLISCFRFSQNPMNWRSSFRDELNFFLNEDHLVFNSIGFNGKPNMQTAYLTQELKWNKKEPFPMYFDEPNISFENVLYLIKKQNMTLSTQDNRDYLLDSISEDLSNKYDKDIKLNKQIKVNINPLEISNSNIPFDILERTKELNYVDYKLYEYVKNHEITHKRALLPEDIVI